MHLRLMSNSNTDVGNKNWIEICWASDAHFLITLLTSTLYNSKHFANYPEESFQLQVKLWCYLQNGIQKHFNITRKEGRGEKEKSNCFKPEEYYRGLQAAWKRCRNLTARRILSISLPQLIKYWHNHLRNHTALWKRECTNQLF